MAKQSVKSKLEEAFAKKKGKPKSSMGTFEPTPNEAGVTLEHSINILEKCIVKAHQDIQANLQAQNKQEGLEGKTIEQAFRSYLQEHPQSSNAKLSFEEVIRAATSLVQIQSDVIWYKFSSEIKSQSAPIYLTDKLFNKIYNTLGSLCDFELVKSTTPGIIGALNYYNTQVDELKFITFCLSYQSKKFTNGLNALFKNDAMRTKAVKSMKSGLNKTQSALIDKKTNANSFNELIDSIAKVNTLIEQFAKLRIASKIYHDNDYMHYAKIQKRIENLYLEIKHWKNNNALILSGLKELNNQITKEKPNQNIEKISNLARQFYQCLQRICLYTPDKGAILLNNVLLGNFYHDSNQTSLLSLAYSLMVSMDIQVFLDESIKQASNYTTIEKKCLLQTIENILNIHATSSQRTDELTEKYNQSIKKIIKVIRHEKNEELYELLGVLEDKSSRPIKFPKESKKSKPIQTSTKTIFNYFKSISNIIPETHASKELASEFIRCIENLYLTKTIRINPLEFASYQLHHHNIQKTTQHSNLNEYFLMDSAIDAYIILSIFFDIDDNIKEKTTFKPIDSTLHFYNLALQCSLENKYKITEYVLKRALNNPIVAKFIDSKHVNLSQLDKVNSKLNFISNFIKKDNVRDPHLELLLKESLVKFQQIKTIPKSLYPGFVASEFEHLKQNISAKNPIYIHLKRLIEPLVHCQIFKPYLIGYRLDQAYFEALIKEQVKNFTPPRRPLIVEQFSDPNIFIDYFKEQSKRCNAIEFESKEPNQALNEIIDSWIKNAPFFERSASILSALWTLHEAFDNGCLPGLDYYRFLNETLTKIHDTIESTIDTDNPNHQKTLASFFATFNKCKILTFLQTDQQDKHEDQDEFDLCVESANKLLQLEKAYALSINSHEALISQKAMTELLDAIISGTPLSTQLFLDTISNESPEFVEKLRQSALMKHLLPEVYPDDPAADLEKSRYFKVGDDSEQESLTVYDNFKTQKLINDFTRSFPWAIPIDEANRAEHAHESKNINLLYSKQAIPADYQVSVLNGIFIALDILGKLVGLDGNLCLHNYVSIKTIIDLINAINESTALYVENPEETQIWLNEQIQNLIEYNHELFEDPPDDLIVVDNFVMNNFCHLNQHLLVKLIGKQHAAQIKSGLYPAQPIDERIRKMLSKDPNS